MSLIDCKVELKLQSTKHCVLAAIGDDNTEAYQRHKMLCPCNHIITERQPKTIKTS